VRQWDGGAMGQHASGTMVLYCQWAVEQWRQWGNKAEEQWASESGGIIPGKQGSKAECIFNRGLV
jgi:hypothetical protein